MIVVLGGGPAGRLAAIRLASSGKQVTLVEHGGIGGQCLHSGCMPVCAMNDVARLIHSARELKDLGVIGTVPGVDFQVLLREMGKIQQKIASILDTETREAGVEILYGKSGRLSGRRAYAGDEDLEAEAVIAATGSRPFVPDIPGVDLPGVLTSRTLPGMKTLPKKIAIIGGSVVAAEFAYIFSTFGSEVTILSRSTFLKDADKHIRALAIKELEGVTIRENAPVSSINGRSRVASVTCKNEEIEADAVFLAAGLVPNSESLEGVKKGALGEVVVDNRMRTSVPDVYACGDVVGPPYLTPVARHQGIVAADNILGIPRTMDYQNIPRSISLTHELAYCINETEGMGSMVFPGPAGPGSFWSVPTGQTGLSKVIFDPETGDIGGICAAGPGGGLIAGYMAFLMKKHFTVHDFEEFIEVHPSTDGVYGLAKYASSVVKKRNNP
ncbi:MULTISPECIES: NAD(P)/FAD-dependent oxidoreductase [unclassified Methanoregula]|uniref:dihydrolipoyl dehydrogenase family protein n=1 Tax=unclassified Methanoregula TaxID=2649730 RepID=UPI0009C54770|nr:MULTISPECIES: NAD(P)/FAD-dependent oxidoreductase [unclassified Methanoregula]OPX64180.1 MAG: Dihydrolipoyl dehydrogenase [Methanoregula sp. PtaB.Bin085]OPY34700.1 MAG: Dihydrolipoyl dehydrogenase [Methanoregula sp. PtaU1.Bin006]